MERRPEARTPFEGGWSVRFSILVVVVAPRTCGYPKESFDILVCGGFHAHLLL
jgi:hypothetical protein